MRIEASGLCKAFGSVEALRNVSLRLEPGARVGLVGPNGSGKSTLIRVLMGLVEADGLVELDGRHPLRDRGALARRIAYVPQIAPGIAAPVEELVDVVAEVRGVESRRVHEIARRLDLDVRALGGRPFRSLSGGMKQKLMIALALAAPASLVVLDEPTASLDGFSRGRFFGLFREVAEDTTLLLCSHRIEEMRHLVSHVVALCEGQVAYSGPVGEYLRETAVSVLQVHVEGTAGEEQWLRERGFEAGVSGWWGKTVSSAEKIELLPAVAERLGPRLRDVLVRDLERLDGETGAHDA